MQWLLWAAFFVQGAMVAFLAYRLDSLERRCQHLTVSARHAYDSAEMLADSIGNLRKTLGEHAVELTDLALEVDKARHEANPWARRGGLN